VSDFLTQVAEKTRLRVEADKTQVSLASLKRTIKADLKKHPFRDALQKPGRVTLIAELKQASPSAGLIRKVPDVAARIKAYEKGGAVALSILTEEDYFHGSPKLLEDVRRMTTLPLLRKDFIVDSYQLYESKSLGADAVLLITSLLPGTHLGELIDEAQRIGLDTLVEVHTEEDLAHALQAKAPIIGINNRNLHTLRVDTTTAHKLLLKAPISSALWVVESGIRSPSELPRLLALGAHAVLIGETLMRAEDPTTLVKEFVHACQK
jgi:indole-3-glycerol phosphate synthase